MISCKLMFGAVLALSPMAVMAKTCPEAATPVVSLDYDSRYQAGKRSCAKPLHKSSVNGAKQRSILLQIPVISSSLQQNRWRMHGAREMVAGARRTDTATRLSR